MSIGEGFDPAWSPDGTVIYYRDADSLYAVDVTDVASMRLSRPKAITAMESEGYYAGSPLTRSYAVHPVTGEIQLSKFVGERAAPKLVFVDGWRGLVK